MKAHGTVHKYGNNVDTDVIIPARHLNTQDHKELASHCMEDIDKDFINKVKQRYTFEIINAKCRPMFQHEYALSRLKHDGYKIAVCSNSVRATIEMMMNLSELSRYIDIILSNEDVANAKPDPEIYTSAMKKLSLAPEECIVIEDNPKGIAAGKASGAFVLPVAGVLDVNYLNISRAIAKFEEGRP